VIELRLSLPEELREFRDMERDEGSRAFVTQYSLARHRQEFAREDIIYLSIYRHGELAGFFILALDPDRSSVEFRRIVVADRDAGIGQPAIRAMETYCSAQLGCRRIWLDVFETNQRARHVYEKLGYRLFGDSLLDGRKLLLYRKQLA
jgi:RimJ/RimL family protein N-acetyltransferase